MNSMRRSLLFIPGNNPGMLQSCDIFEADAVIFDLEDAVSGTEKDSARFLVTNYLKTYNPELEVVVRINGFDTPFYQKDLEELLALENLHTIMLPKARVVDLVTLTRMIKDAKRDIKIIPIIEQAISLIEVEEIARFELVDGILLGAEDYTKDLEVTRTKEGNEIFYARNRIITACKAYKIDAIDTPFTDTNDNEGLVKDTLFAKSIGMNAKSAIHPNQVETINKLFTPTDREIEYAKRVLIARDEAFKKGLGVFSLDGKMVDKPVIERAEKVIEKAKKFGVL
ncbi:MAG: HpcH/HpaI aldolase/citrate lyase family protein [Bacilli bacterium]|nr:HpcH/HpaI aldolase/citrate lyase family protein [Bacilli bacterium]